MIPTISSRWWSVPARPIDTICQTHSAKSDCDAIRKISLRTPEPRFHYSILILSLKRLMNLLFDSSPPVALPLIQMGG